MLCIYGAYDQTESGASRVAYNMRMITGHHFRTANTCLDSPNILVLPPNRESGTPR